MEYATQATVPEGVRFGTRYLNERILERTRILVVATDVDNAIKVIRTAIGAQAAPNGNFAFVVDDAVDWFRSTDVHQPGPMGLAVDAVLSAQRLLGSVTLSAAVFRFNDSDDLTCFWIEASENEKRRVISAKRQNGSESFSGMPDDWEFHSANIAHGLLKQF